MARCLIANSLVFILLLKLVTGDVVTDSRESCEKLDIVLKHPNCFSHLKWKMKAQIFCQISVQSDSSQNFWLKKNHAEQEMITLTQPCHFGRSSQGSSFGFKKASFWCCFKTTDKKSITAIKKTISPSNESVPKLLMRSTVDDGKDGVSVIDQRTNSQKLRTTQNAKLHVPTQKVSTIESVSPLEKTSIFTKHAEKCDTGPVIGLYKSMIPKHKGICEFYASYLEDFADTENWHSSSVDLLKEQLKVGKNRYLALKAKNEKLAQRRLNQSLAIWKDMLKSIDKEYKQGQKSLNGKHHLCVLSQFSNTKRKLMKNFVAWIQTGAMLNKPHFVASISKVIQDMVLLIDEVKRYHTSLFASTSSPKDIYKPAYVNIDSYEIMVHKSLEIVKCLPEMALKPKSMGKTALPQSMAQLPTLTRYDVIKAFFDLGVNNNKRHSHRNILKILNNFEKFSMTKDEEIFTTPKLTITTDTSFVGSGDEEKYTEGSGSSSLTYSGDNDNEYSGDNEDDGGSGGGKYKTISLSSKIPKKRRTKEIIATKGEDEIPKQKQSDNPEVKLSSSTATIALATPKHMFYETYSTTHAPAQPNKLASAVQKMLADFPNERVGCDLSSYDKKEEEMRTKYQTHIFSIVEKWNRAQEKYKRLSKKDKRKAEKFLLKTLASLTRELNGVKQSQEVEREETRRNRAQCLNKQILKDQRDSLVKFTESVQKAGVLDVNEVTGHLSQFISSCQHLRVYKMQFNKDSEMYTVRYKIKEHIKELNQVMKRVTALLEHLPNADDAVAIKREVWLLQINFTFKTLTSL